MRIVIELTADFGHPNNEPTKQGMLKAVVERLPELLKQDKDNAFTGLYRWSISGVKVE
jgi:hypothetical protein